MKRNRVLWLLGMLICFVPNGYLSAADLDCLKRIDKIAGSVRKDVVLYSDEFKVMSDNPWARNSESTCKGALQRAESYYQRQVDDKSVCELGSSYVDSQVVQLYKNAGSTCRSEYDTLVNRLSPEDRQIALDRFARKQAMQH
ncbi:MAG: hypothetical protein IPK66_09910 [Rhodospirillales bacterium]|nr:hypothetical protein [Rhodospirillales bacterium]